MSTEQTIPSGYWKNGHDALIPVSKIKPIDKDRHQVVVDLCKAANEESARLMAFKTTAMCAVSEFIDRSLAEYDVAHGGKKGNVKLLSFDEKFMVVRQMQDSISFDERLLAAKAKIDECIQAWSKGSNANIKVLVNDAFQVDQQGKISTGRVLGLKRLEIDDPRWHEAMRAIHDSMMVTSTKPYIRFYERDENTGKYLPINLDVAAV
nr:DUF3164 family protein [uncultured Albidiferax sp.]